MSDSRHIQLLLSNRIFAGLSATDAQALFEGGKLVHSAAGELLFRKGDLADGFYLVLSGYLGVTLTGESGEEIPLADIGPGETLGEMGIVTAAPRTATVTAVVEAVSWHLPAEVFEGLVARGDPIGGAILRSMGRDLCRRFRSAVDEGARLTSMLMRKDRQELYVDSLGWEV